LQEASAGIDLRAEPVTDLVQDADGVRVNWRRARYLLAADWLHSPTRRRLGLDAPVPGARRYGIRAHVETPPWTDFVEVHWAHGAEAYVTPLGPALVGVAVLTAEPGPFDTLLRRFPALRERLAGAPVSRALGAGPLRQRSTRRVAGRVLLVGDASGYVDALTGEGIALGLAQARAAVQAIVAGRPEDYESSWRQVSRRYQLITQALLGATRVRTARRALVPVAATVPAAFAVVVNQLAR
jgi:flavin-dependent dehydrogenase